jgi:hypothetical protein
VAKSNYKRKANGQFDGSEALLAGKSKVPTAQPVLPAFRNIDKALDNATRDLEALDDRIQGMFNEYRAARDAETVDEDIVEAEIVEEEEFIPEDELEYTEDEDSHGITSMLDLTWSSYHGTVYHSFDKPGEYVATVEAGEAVNGMSTLVKSKFTSKFEALTWAQDELLARQAEVDLFERKIDEDPEAFGRALDAHVKALRGIFDRTENLDGSETFWYEDREGNLASLGGNRFEVSIDRVDDNGTYNHMHTRVFNNYQMARDFTRAMVLLADRD